ncbi:hypothetical protein FOXYSP1_02378 [Fusarium oxysporum f. sp. phaseoli]
MTAVEFLAQTIDHRILNVEGNPEAPLLGDGINSRTPFRQSDNPFIRLPTRAIIATWFALVILSLLSLGLTLVYLSIEEGFNLAFFFGASAVFLILAGIGTVVRSRG